MKNVIQTSVKLAALFLGLMGAVLPFRAFAGEEPIPASSNPDPQGGVVSVGENSVSGVSSVSNDAKDPLTAGPLSAAMPETAEDPSKREALRASLLAGAMKKSAAAGKEIERLGIVLREETKKVNARIASADRRMKEVADSLVRRSQELTQIQSQPAVADSTKTAIQKFKDSVQALIKSLPEKNRKFYQALRASAQRQTSSDIESNKIYRKALTVYEEKVKKASSTDELKSLAGQIPVFKKRTVRLADPLSLNPRPAFTDAGQEGERLRLRAKGEIDKFRKARTALLDRNTNEIRATQEALDKLQADLKKAESETAARIHSIDGESLQLGGSLTSLLEALKKVQKRAGTADAAQEAIQKFIVSAKALLNSLPKRREQFNEAQRVSSLAQLFSDRRNSRKYLNDLEAYQKKAVVVQNIGQIEKLAKEFPALKKEILKPQDPKPLDPRPVLVKTIEEGNQILSQAQRRG